MYKSSTKVITKKNPHVIKKLIWFILIYIFLDQILVSNQSHRISCSFNIVERL